MSQIGPALRSRVPLGHEVIPFLVTQGVRGESECLRTSQMWQVSDSYCLTLSHICYISIPEGWDRGWKTLTDSWKPRSFHTSICLVIFEFLRNRNHFNYRTFHTTLWHLSIVFASINSLETGSWFLIYSRVEKGKLAPHLVGEEDIANSAALGFIVSRRGHSWERTAQLGQGVWWRDAGITQELGYVLPPTCLTLTLKREREKQFCFPVQIIKRWSWMRVQVEQGERHDTPNLHRWCYSNDLSKDIRWVSGTAGKRNWVQRKGTERGASTE